MFFLEPLALHRSFQKSCALSLRLWCFALGLKCVRGWWGCSWTPWSFSLCTSGWMACIKQVKKTARRSCPGWRHGVYNRGLWVCLPESFPFLIIHEQGNEHHTLPMHIFLSSSSGGYYASFRSRTCFFYNIPSAECLEAGCVLSSVLILGKQVLCSALLRAQ